MIVIPAETGTPGQEVSAMQHEASACAVATESYETR